MKARLHALARHPATAWTRAQLRLGLMPFRAARPLEPRERWVVVFVWGALGGVFACAWLALLAALLPGLRHGAGWLALAALLLGAIAFFGAGGYLMTRIGNRLVSRKHPRGGGVKL